MPAPHGPSAFLAAIPSVASAFCGRFAAFLRFPRLFADQYEYERTELGEISDEFCADIISCVTGNTVVVPGGGGGGGTGGLATPVISATDGTLPSSVGVSWSPINGASSYLIYRAVSDNLSQAIQIGTSAVASFSDTTAAVNSTYWYWVKATDGTNYSAISNSDSGYYSTALPAVTDLEASKGYTSSLNPSPAVFLQWTAISGATAYDVYRGTTNVFAAGTTSRVAADKVPFDNAAALSIGNAPYMINNGTDLTFIDHPPTNRDEYFYWVVAKKSNPAALSPESNTTSGWCIGWGDGTVPTEAAYLTSTTPSLVIGAGTRAWIYMYGAGGCGAGAGAVFGGGGGGGGATLWGEKAVAPGGLFRLVATGTAPANAAAATSGQAGQKWELQYQPPAGAYATIMTSDAAGGGVYDAAGGGAGGVGSVATLAGAVTGGGSHDGYAGMAAVGSNGGRGGKVFGGYRQPPAHFNGVAGFNGDGEAAGSGSVSLGATLLASATGGKTFTASVSIVCR